jgi:hypothetical protein
MFWRSVGRLILIPIAVLLAGATAFFILITLGLERLTHALGGDPMQADGMGMLVNIVVDGGFLASSLTVIPALAVLIVGEVARIRALSYYVIGGGVALAAIPLIASGTSPDMTLSSPALWQVFATAGFAGGFVYWLLAGRSA